MKTVIGTSIRTFAALIIVLATAVTAHALELIMVEQKGCYYCDLWKSEIGPIYPKTELASAAPLRHVDIRGLKTSGLAPSRAVFFTPTFLLVDDEGREIDRIEGYQSEDFFWALIEEKIAIAHENGTQ